jgi:HD-GYP domain-containing protein (c-di-GMP phosphodiesterase class II)
MERMRRTVLYDAGSAVAGAAVAQLTGAFDVRPFRAGDCLADPTPAVVVLADAPADPGSASPADPGPAAHLRTVALVSPGATGPWPAHWYAVLPADVPSAMLARAVDRAFADLDAGLELRRLGGELSALNAIGIMLSSERNPDALLDLVLSTARRITASDAGSLYLVEETPEGERELFFALAQNDSVDVPFRASRLPLTSASVAGHVALTGTAVNLADAYEPPAGSPFHINRAFDERTGYRTKSMLVVPMQTPQGEVIGVLQLINCKPGSAAKLRTAVDVDEHVQPFSAAYEQLAGSLASQAAVAVHNSRLYHSIRRLFDGFVAASVTAIESRDPATSGHSFRVAGLCVGLAEVVDRCATGPYAAHRFTPDEVMELRYAALLHDFGKVGVREHVLVKAKKLYPAELERIRQRIALVKRGLELRCAAQKIDHLRTAGRRGYARQAAALDGTLQTSLAELDRILHRIVAANEPAVLPADLAAEIEELARREFEDERGHRVTVITAEEAAILAIRQGSLTGDEIQQIRSHVQHTVDFLARIPWTREFRRIPDIAHAHHEKLDGSGYPRGITADDIPVQSRIMAIADIYDALSASDRPYKRAVTTQQALAILDAERRRGALDSHLLDLFVDARVYAGRGRTA